MTAFRYLSDEELIRMVRTAHNTEPLIRELADRLEKAIDALDELKNPQ